uniref:Integrase catalytic domain-containing protein n=1 Tax=Latimeria chalumnae TaxID=7897 RepID=H3A6G4_LATCH
VFNSRVQLPNIQESLIRDRLVIGCSDHKVRKCLLRDCELTLEKAIRICKAAELTKKKISVMAKEDKKVCVQLVKKVDASYTKLKSDKNKMHHRKGKQKETYKHTKGKSCGKCCKFCGKYNNFARQCKSKANLHAVRESSTDSSENELKIDAIQQNSGTEKEWTIDIETNGPMIKYKVDTAWGTIGVDMSTLEGKEYLAIIDAYSNYPEVVKLKHTISEEVYRKLKPIFCRYGIPSTVRTDNGPQSIGKDFVKFKEELGFKHITSSPKYPQSNGLAECGVKTVKHLLKKAMYSGEDPQIALLNYRATALEGGKSPAELLFGRQLSTKLLQLELKHFHNNRKLHKKYRG